MLDCTILIRRWNRIQFAKSRFALRRGASEGVYPRRSSTERATKPQGKPAFARRVAALLARGFVSRRGRRALPLCSPPPPSPQAQSPSTNFVLSHPLVHMLL